MDAHNIALNGLRVAREELSLEGNACWLDGLARNVAATGKDVDDLTVLELRSLIAQSREEYNLIHGGVL